MKSSTMKRIAFLLYGSPIDSPHNYNLASLRKVVERNKATAYCDIFIWQDGGVRDQNYNAAVHAVAQPTKHSSPSGVMRLLDPDRDRYDYHVLLQMDTELSEDFPIISELPGHNYETEDRLVDIFGRKKLELHLFSPIPWTWGGAWINLRRVCRHLTAYPIVYDGVWIHMLEPGITYVTHYGVYARLENGIITCKFPPKSSTRPYQWLALNKEVFKYRMRNIGPKFTTKSGLATFLEPLRNSSEWHAFDNLTRVGMYVVNFDSYFNSEEIVIEIEIVQ